MLRRFFIALCLISAVAAANAIERSEKSVGPRNSYTTSNR